MSRVLWMAGLWMTACQGPLPAAAGGQAGQPEVLTLDQAVAIALKQNPRVAGAAADLREAKARVRQKRALQRPQAGVDNFVLRQGPTVPPFRPGDNPAVPPYRWNVGVFVTQVLWDFHRRGADRRSTERAADAADHLRFEVENDVRYVVSVAYFSILRAETLVEVARERLATAREQLRVSRARFEAGVAPRYDVIRAEAEEAAAEQERIAAENHRLLAIAALNTAMGRQEDTLVTIAAVPTAAPVAEEPSPEQLRELAFRNRPLLQALGNQVDAGRELVRSRRAEHLPEISFTGTYDRPNPGGFASTEYRFSAGLFLRHTFFDSGLVRGRVREAQAGLESDRQLLESERLRISLEVRQAYLDLQEARARIHVARKEQDAAREALRVAQVRYSAGLGTSVEVTDAQVALARAGQNLADARYDELASAARLEAATGTRRPDAGSRTGP